MNEAAAASGEGGASGDAAAAASAADSAAAGGAAAASGAGVQAFDWKTAGLEAENLAYIESKGFQKPADVVNSYRNLEKLTGVPPEQIIKLPKEMNDATMGEVYDRLGRPKTAAEYNIPIPEGGSKEFAATASDWFHKRGLSAAQALGVSEDWNAFVAADVAKREADYNASVQMDTIKLKTEWGADKYDSNLAIARQAAATFGITAEQISGMEKTLGFGGVYRLMYGIGSKIGEATFVQNGGSLSSFQGLTPETARAQIAANMKDKTFQAKFNSNDPVVKGDARKEMDRLHAVAHPGTMTM
jgi:hypothetical protein